MSGEIQQETGGIPGPARQWLERFLEGCRTRLSMLLLGQLIALGFLCWSTLIVRMLVGVQADPLIDIAANDTFFLFSAPAVWIGMVMWLRNRLQDEAEEYYSEQYRRSNIVFELFSSDGDKDRGQSFRRRLQASLRTLPHRLREQGCLLFTETPGVQRILFGCMLVVTAWLGFMHLILASSLEFLALGIVLVFMLLDYRRKLDRILREQAFAHHLLGL